MKFFRNIRKAHFDEGKTIKYFKYALGEILLVVIGIVIALQLNNLNENRKEERLLAGYLQTIRTNIQKDLESLERLKSMRDSIRIQANRAIEKLNAQEYRNQDVSILSKGLLNSYLVIHFNPEKSGFEALKTTGFISKIQGSKLERLLFDYYHFALIVYDAENDLKTYIGSLQLTLVNTTEARNLNYTTRAAGTQWNGDFSLEFLKNNQELIKEFYRLPSVNAILGRISSEINLNPAYDYLTALGMQILNEIEVIN